MNKEYLVFQTRYKSCEEEKAALNDAAQRGWQLISVTASEGGYSRFYMGREKLQ